ncbi:AAA family ATPase [Bordetella sp. 2513F-2]
MKLHRVRLSAFRRFRETAELDDLEPGLNIFFGPNEAGKSTCAAAIRAAFLERYKTRTVADFAPWDMPGARPTVELAFAHGGHEYVLQKSFLSRPRCELVVDGGARRLEGEEAEDALAGLLGFGFPAKGQSRPEHAGLPGLLWIAQGEGQELLAPARHADTQVRELLTQLTGELAAGDGDRLFERVAAERAELFDARSGKPKGVYREAEEAHAQAAQRCEQLARERAALDADVDQLARLRAEDERARRDAPWREFEARAAQARARLAELAREREELERLQHEQAQAGSTLALLQEQMARDERDRQALAALQVREQSARESAAQAAVQADEARRSMDALAGQLEAGRARLAAAQAQAERRDLDEQLARLGEELARLDGALDQAAALAARVQDLQARRLQRDADPGDLARLRAAEQERVELSAQQRAVATRLRYRLEGGADARLDDAPLAAEGVCLLTGPGRLMLPAVGEFIIEPGGQDLPALQARIADLDAVRAQLLRRLGAADLAQAEAHAREAERLAVELEATRRELAIHAPRGQDALRTARAEAAQRLERLQARRAALADTPSAQEAPDPEEAARALRLAEEAATQARAAWAEAQRAADGHAAQARLLGEQARALQDEFADTARESERQARAARAAQARALRDALQARVAEAQARLASQQPELVAQDAERYERSAALERLAHQARQAELLQLQGRLQQAGAQGLGERLAQARADEERLARRRDDVARHAGALDLLWRMLAAQREAATRRLLDPLARRLAHYLPLLLPDARVQFDEQLLPAMLERDGQGQALPLLSFGTREQLGVLARLAYADLLREAGRPALLILDDTLVHADAQRRDRMKRALFDAASRHQILLFTCHAESWTDMGVPVRRLG